MGPTLFWGPRGALALGLKADKTIIVKFEGSTAVPLHAPSDAATDILVDELRAIIRASERREEDLRQEA